MKASWSALEAQTSKTTQPPSLAPPVWLIHPRRPVALAAFRVDAEQAVYLLIPLDTEAIELENQTVRHLPPLRWNP
jgi:hypothetical protein